MWTAPSGSISMTFVAILFLKKDSSQWIYLRTAVHSSTKIYTI